MIEFEFDEIYGLTLEEAVRFLYPKGWHTTVHRYEEDDYALEEMNISEKKYTVSLDIQDGKVYKYVIHEPKKRNE